MSFFESNYPETKTKGEPSLPDLQLERLRQETKAALRWAKKEHKNKNDLHSDELDDAFKRAEEAYKYSKKVEKKHGLLVDEKSLAQSDARRSYGEVAQLLSEESKEIRACWLDRRSIVSGGPGKVREKIEELNKAGINQIYFESDNGGYALHNSTVLKKNPDLEKWNDWDPLQEAIDAAHARGMKIEAWSKAFAVCNRVLDDQFRQKYPDRKFPAEGPVLSEHKAIDENYGDWALRMADGSLPQRTTDLFIDPANPKAREFAQNVILELSQNYRDLDGFQYDYIRYPFHNEQMGFTENNWKQFQTRFQRYSEMQKPDHPSKMSGQMLRDWNEWKVSQIDCFVQDTSTKLLLKNPNFDISAAVYPSDLKQTVRQEWGRWLKNGWVKTLNPMTYVPHDVHSKNAEFTSEFANKFRSDIREIQKESGGAGKLLPGIAVARVNPGGVIKQIEIAQRMGLPGETLFASSVLDSGRLKELEAYNAKTAFSEFASLLSSVWSVPEKDPSSRLQHQRFIRDAKNLARCLADRNQEKDDGDARQQLEAFKSEINFWLDQNPHEKTAWTDAFRKRLSKIR